MNYKLLGLLILIFTLPALQVNAQRADSTKITGTICASTLNYRNCKPPLFIINGKEIRCSRDIIPDSISEINILKGQAAIDAYGEKAKNGVLLFTVKMKMDLISSDEILKREFINESCKNRKVVFKPAEGDDEEYDQNHVVYFEKNRIRMKVSRTGKDCIVMVQQN